MERLSGLNNSNDSRAKYHDFSIHACIRNQIIPSSDVTKYLVYLLWLVERSALTSGMMLYEQVPVFILSNKMRMGNEAWIQLWNDAMALMAAVTR